MCLCVCMYIVILPVFSKVSISKLTKSPGEKVLKYKMRYTIRHLYIGYTNPVHIFLIESIM